VLKGKQRARVREAEISHVSKAQHDDEALNEATNTNEISDFYKSVIMAFMI
jgi:hypothetical protein